MCGIAGFLDFSKKLQRHHLQGMATCLSHRGPDGEGVFFHDTDSYNVGLGHKRLSIIDLSSAANQPFYSRDGRYVMVFNGEIYNYQELAVRYSIQQQTSSDTEILIEAFAQRGIDCVQEFNGMFAIAIWDLQEQKLFLIRDRFGVKPLLVYQKDGMLAFASELKAILQLPVKKEINKQALQDYLFLEYIPGPASMLENCHKLQNGHFMVIDSDGARTKSYYNFYEKVLARPLAAVTEAQALDEFESLLSSAVKYRQVSDVPVGAFLSGGTDSSLICSIFQQQNERPIKTFTIGFDVADFDETKYASAVAGILKTDHKEFHLTDRDSLSIIEHLVHYYDEPFAAPSTIPSYLVCHEARKIVTVAMSGDGGDELFMGYGYYHLYSKLRKLYRIAPSLARSVLKNVLSLGGNRYERVSRMFALPPDKLMVHLWSEQQYMFTEKEISQLTTGNYKNASLATEWEKIDAMTLSDQEKISLFDINQYLAHNLLFKMDSASMANSLEVRNPFLDYRLVEFSFNLPQDLKIKDGEQKYLMKKLLERYLPKDLIYRKKWGFPAPLGKWLNHELNYLIDKWLNPELIRSQGLLNPEMVAQYVTLFRRGKEYHYKRIWSLIVFQMWYSHYFAPHAD